MLQAVVFTKKGMILKFKVSDVRLTQRYGKGVSAIKLSEGDEVVSAKVFDGGDE